MKRLAILLALLATSAAAEVTTRPPGGSLSGAFSCTPLACTLTAPILAPAANNCASVPYSFTGDTDSGLCSTAADTLQFYAGGSSQLTITTGTLTTTNTIRVSLDGTTTPVFTFGTLGTTHVYHYSTRRLQFGSDVADASGTTFYLSGPSSTGAGNDGGRLSLLGGDGGAGAIAGPVRLQGGTVEIYTGESERGFVMTASDLTGGVATTVVTVGLAGAGNGTAVGGSLEYTIVARDATDSQTRHGSFHYAAGNKSGTETCTISAASEAADGSVLATTEAVPGTLTYAITCDTSGSNAIALQFNAVSSLVETSLTIAARLNLDCDPTASTSCSVTLP